MDNLTQDFSVNPAQFQQCCKMFFPLHRIFVNYKQLYTAADLLFKQWKIVMKASQKSIRCNYSHTPHLSNSKKDSSSSFHPKKNEKLVSMLINESNVPSVSTGHLLIMNLLTKTIFFTRLGFLI